MEKTLKVIFLILILTPAAQAEIKVEFPLQGCYRPGQMFPVRLINDGPPTTVTIGGDDVVPTHVEVDREAIVPVLPLAVIGQLEIRSDKPQIIALPRPPLSENERVVGYFDPMSADEARRRGAAAFPQSQIIPIPLNREMNLPMPMWQSIDGIILPYQDSIMTGPLSWQDIEALGAAVIEPESGKIHTAPLRTPRTVVTGEGAYLPVFFWDRGRSTVFRRSIVLGGVLIALLTLATLLPRRSAFSLGVGLSVISAAAVVLAGRGSGTIVASGGVFYSGEVRHASGWRYVSACAATAGEAPLDLIPALVDFSQAKNTGLAIDINRNPQLSRWRFNLQRGQVLAFHDERIGAQEWWMQPDELASHTPMVALAQEMFLRSGYRIAGMWTVQSQPGETGWPTVVIERTPFR